MAQELPFIDMLIHQTIQKCVGIFYQPNAYGFAEDGYLLPGSICAIAPLLLDIVMCWRAHSVELDYGNVGKMN